jgi:hypothetical protein
MFKDNKALHAAILKTKLADFKVTLSGKKYCQGVTITKKGAAQVQVWMGHHRGNNRWRISAYFNPKSGPNRTSGYGDWNDFLKEALAFLKKAKVVKVIPSNKKKKHAKNQLKLLRKYEARSPLVFRKNECINAKIYLYGSKKTDLGDPEAEDITIKADLWVTTGDMTYKNIKYKYQGPNVEFWTRCIVETDGNGAITRMYHIWPEDQKEIDIKVINPEFVEEAIREAFFGKQ